MSEERDPDPYVLYACVSRTALKAMNGVRGKLGAQTGHAFMHAFWDADNRFPDAARAYRYSQRAYKVVLVVEDDAVLDEILEACRPIAGVTDVVDAAFTVFDKPTRTAVGVGPIRKSERPAILASLKGLS